MMHNPIEMMTFRNPPDPGDGPAPYRSANQPSGDARQNYGGDLDEVGKNGYHRAGASRPARNTSSRSARPRVLRFLPLKHRRFGREKRPRMAKRTLKFNVERSVSADASGRGPTPRECFAPIMLKNDTRLKPPLRRRAALRYA